MRISNLVRRFSDVVRKGEDKVIAFDHAVYERVVAPLANKAMDASAKLQRAKCDVAARVLVRADPALAVDILTNALLKEI